MASALGYQIGTGTVGIPLAFPTKGGMRCGHYVPVRSSTGRQAYAFRRDPNSVCGLPTQKPNVAACAQNPALCRNQPLPAGWTPVGQARITGVGQGEQLGGVAIR